MDMLKRIRERTAIRKYCDKMVPKEIIDQIIQAGIWGPSLMGPGFQPWKIVVVKGKGNIEKINKIITEELCMPGVGKNLILRTTIGVISSAPVVFFVYSDSAVINFVKRLDDGYESFADMAEVSAISAAIQNMILVADSLGVGSCWLDAPLFCQKEINNFFNTNQKLIAVLTLGYSVKKSSRSPRKPIGESVVYFD
ncbi:MAG: nitroreductase family protein [Candidatus Omnitrophica bacterium]|nr:nitroreductase family protein [Candidatus Omnitrophota bacterium]